MNSVCVAEDLLKLDSTKNIKDFKSLVGLVFSLAFHISYPHGVQSWGGPKTLAMPYIHCHTVSLFRLHVSRIPQDFTAYPLFPEQGWLSLGIIPICWGRMGGQTGGKSTIV